MNYKSYKFKCAKWNNVFNIKSDNRKNAEYKYFTFGGMCIKCMKKYQNWWNKIYDDAKDYRKYFIKIMNNIFDSRKE